MTDYQPRSDGSEPIRPTAGHRYFTRDGGRDVWRSRERELTEEAIAASRDLVEDDGLAGLREAIAVLDDQLDEQTGRRQRVQRTRDAYSLLAFHIGCSARLDDPTAAFQDEWNAACACGRCGEVLIDEVPLTPVDAPLRSEQDYWGPLGRHPNGADEYQLVVTLPVLQCHDLPAQQGQFLEFGVVLPEDATWAQAGQQAAEKRDYWRQQWMQLDLRCAELEARRSVYRQVAMRFAQGQTLPWDAAREPYPTTADCAEAVLVATDKVEKLNRKQLLKKAAEDLDLSWQYDAPVSKVERELGDLYPKQTGGDGRADKSTSRRLGEMLVENCRAWLHGETETETES